MDILCPLASSCKKISIVNIESSTVTNHKIIQTREGKDRLSHPLHLLPRQASFLPYIIKCFVQLSFKLFKQFDICFFLWENTLQFNSEVRLFIPCSINKMFFAYLHYFKNLLPNSFFFKLYFITIGDEMQNGECRGL